MRASTVLFVLLALRMLFACGDRNVSREVAAHPRSPARADEWSFGSDAIGAAPEGFTVISGTWVVAEDATAPGDGLVLAPTAASSPAETNLVLLDQPRHADVGLSVRVRAVEGQSEHGGGLVWRARDAKNYYLAHWDPLGKHYRLYRVIDGVHEALASADIEASPGWHALAVMARGDKIECFLGGRSHFVVHDATYNGSGQVGLWTSVGARPQFDDLQVRLLR